MFSLVTTGLITVKTTVKVDQERMSRTRVCAAACDLVIIIWVTLLVLS